MGALKKRCAPIIHNFWMLDCWPGIKWRFFTSISIKSTTFKNIITFINRRHQPLLCTSPFTIIIPLSGAEATNEQATSFLPTPTFEESNAMPSSATKDYYDEGQILKAVSGRTYRIKEKISAGGYGAVYKVSGKTNDNKNGEFALKVERRNPIRNHFKLTMEKQVLIAAKNVDAVYRQHFPTLIDVMQNDDRMFVVMTLLGDSLADIKRKRPDRIFSANTGFYCALQCLEAISNLHALGFVHRDIKPANFVIGRRFEPSQNVVYMVDYGIARDFKDANGSIKTPREKTKFKGTVRFAPLATHKQKELGRKDDCESWIYMIVDMIGKKRLPWQELDDRVKVQGMKEKALADPKELFPDENHKDLISIVKYLCAQDYVSPIDYNWMRDIVKRAAKRDKCTLAQPYDWMNPIRSSNRE